MSGGKASRGIGKERRDWSRMKGSQAAAGITTQGDEWLLRDGFTFSFAVP